MADGRTKPAIEIEFDFHGGVTLGMSGAKNGLLAAVELGMIDKPTAIEINMLIREAVKQLQDTMTSD